MSLINLLFPLSVLGSIFSCHTTDLPSVAPRATAPLRTETLTRYLPAAPGTAAKRLNLPTVKVNGVVYEAIAHSKTTYAYDAQGRLLTETATEPLRPTDPYGYNWTRRYTYLGNELTIETTGVGGKTSTPVRLRLNAQGFATGDLADPNQVWVYGSNNQLLRRNTIEQTFKDGNRVRQTNISEETIFGYDLDKLNPVPTPTRMLWGEPDRNLLTNTTTRLLNNSNAPISGVEATYTYDLNAQGQVTRRIVYKSTKPAAGYTMATGSSDDQVEITAYSYE
jgi:hypothetical protein